MELIDRQTAINTADTMFARCDTGCLQDYHDLMVEAFNVLPSVEAEPVRHGKWVNKNNGKWNTLPVFMCSECGDYDPRLYGNENYCPNCGAKMEVDDDTD